MTPYVETITPELGQLELHWQNWYYQVKKEGFYDSEVIFKEQSTGDRKVHFKLKTKLQLSVSAIGAVGTLEKKGDATNASKLSPSALIMLK